jgi:hypothetical protein
MKMTQNTLVPDGYAGAERRTLYRIVFAQTSKLVIESGDSAQSRQQAAMEKEQWNDTRSLRQKVNKRAEKEWDKADVAFDAQDNCQKSANVNAYWEPNTLRCLDRRTGRIAPQSVTHPWRRRRFALSTGTAMTDAYSIKLRPLEREDLRFVHQLDNNASVMRYWFEEPYEALLSSPTCTINIHDQSERRFVIECNGEKAGLVELVEINHVHRRAEFQSSFHRIIREKVWRHAPRSWRWTTVYRSQSV